MKPNWTRTLILTVLLCAIGGGAYWLQYTYRPKKDKEEEVSKKPFSFEGATILEMTLDYGKNRTFTFACENTVEKKCAPGQEGKWNISKPMASEADHVNVNSVVSSFNNLMVEETISLKDDSEEKRKELLAEYGLSESALSSGGVGKIEIKLSDGKSKILHLGGTHPIGAKIFALLESDGKLDTQTVWLLPSFTRNNLEHDLNYWRNKKVFAFESGKITGLHFTGKSSFDLAKKDGKWVLNIKGIREEFATDPESVETLLSSLSFLSATGFASSEEMKSAPSTTKALLNFEKGETVSFEVFEKKLNVPPGAKFNSKIYLKVASKPEIYELDEAALGRIQKSGNDLRVSKLLPGMDRFQAKNLKFSGGTQGTAKWALNTQKKETWIAEKETAFDPEKVQTFLDLLSVARIKKFEPKTASIMKTASEFQVEISDEKDQQKRKLHFWKANGKTYAQDLLLKRDEVYQLDQPYDSSLPWTKDFFLKGKTSDGKN